VGVHQGDAVILKIASKTTVILSQVVNTASINATFTFSPPKPLLWTPTKQGDPGYPLIGDKFQFSGEPAWHDPYAFSQQVYLIMASINQISVANNNNVCKFMQDVIGANMGFIFTQAAKDSDDGKMVSAMIRDMIKSVLRGVSDFTKYPDVVNNQGDHTSWYPDPSERHGNQAFNVFNLDPYVWFVHVKLKFSGYGFSVDDDTADVGAGGASQLQVTVTGQSPLVERTSNKIGGTLSRKEIEEVPSNFRNFTALTQLIPGMTPNPAASSFEGGQVVAFRAQAVDDPGTERGAAEPRPAGAHPRAEGLRQARDRGRLPGPRAVRQPGRRPEHVPRP